MPKLKLETNEHFLELRLKGYRQFNSTLLENVFFLIVSLTTQTVKTKTNLLL